MGSSQNKLMVVINSFWTTVERMRTTGCEDTQNFTELIRRVLGVFFFFFYEICCQGEAETKFSFSVVCGVDSTVRGYKYIIHTQHTASSHCRLTHIVLMYFIIKLIKTQHVCGETLGIYSTGNGRSQTVNHTHLLY